jgi:hypothetical protein
MRIRIAETGSRDDAKGATRETIQTITEEEPSPHLQPKNFSSTQPAEAGQTEETRDVVAVPTLGRCWSTGWAGARANTFRGVKYGRFPPDASEILMSENLPRHHGATGSANS